MSTYQVQTFETRHRTKSGNIIPMEISSSRVVYYSETAILRVVREKVKELEDKQKE